jgi:hypothetical protein
MVYNKSMKNETTPMTLSPEAQAVLDAYKAVNCDPFLGNPPEAALAAALRAAAMQSTFADVAVNKTIEIVPVDILLAIATELEAQ